MKEIVKNVHVNLSLSKAVMHIKRAEKIAGCKGKEELRCALLELSYSVHRDMAAVYGALTKCTPGQIQVAINTVLQTPSTMQKPLRGRGQKTVKVRKRRRRL